MSFARVRPSPRVKGLLVVLLLGMTGGLGACGGLGGGEATFAVDRQAVLDLGLLSLTVEVYAGEDTNGGLVDCDQLVAAYASTADFVSVATAQVIELAGENSITVEVGDLPAGIAFFLVLGHDQPAAAGTITHAGCGQGVIRLGEKTPVTVALTPVP